MANTQEELKKTWQNQIYSAGQPWDTADEDGGNGYSPEADLSKDGAAGSALSSSTYGLSDSTLSGLQQYAQGYTPSAAVTQAKEYLQGVMDSQPAAFQSKYTRQIADMYNKIMNRPEFKYDVSKDPLFASYKNQYMQNGQRAMQDAMGTAAALTGGYGNSWGTTAGYQAYQWYLQQLNSVIPELEQYAFDKYKYYGEELRGNLNMTTNLDSIDYGRYRDTVSDWQTSVDMAQNAYQYEQNSDLAMWENMLDYYMNLAGMETSNYWKQQNLDQEQKKWEAEYALDQAKFDFQVRQYEDALRQLEQQSGGGGTGTGTGTGNGGGTVAKASEEVGSTGETSALVSLPVLETNLKGGTNAGPLAQSTPAIPVDQAQTLLGQMEALYKNSAQGKNAEKKTAQANALNELAKEMTKSDAAGLMASNLGWAALQAAKDILESRKN
ncbi:MAG: hypothetical protein IKO52_06265 [Clostridia bacterium]|nr:hypothetical protein [Clostridia bacterium]